MSLLIQQLKPLPAKRALYVMIKLPLHERKAVASMSRYSTVRNPSLLHCTILPLFDLAEYPQELDVFVDLMGDFRATAFYLRFDCIVEKGVVALSSRTRSRGATEVQQHLVHFLRTRGFSQFGTPPRPHVTINYNGDGKGNETIPPISWRVEELLLIESLGGKSTHLVRGRWQLDPLLI